jgi:colanic acid biosynthesis glycosyl transferase WcaI
VRVLLVSQYFPPETGAAPARALHFARALARAGHEVRVLTGLPNHPSGVVQDAYARTRRATERLADAEGVTVERVWLHATPRRTALTRLWNHLTFAWSALPVALAGPAPDVIVASVPPLFLGLTARLASWRHRAPLVLDMRDDWPHAALSMGEMQPGLAASALEGISRSLQRAAARVVAVTPGMRRALESRGLDPGRIALITNGADTELLTPRPPRAPGAARSGPFTVLYAGTHGLVHGMEALIDAAERLRGRTDVRFLLVGDGVAKPALEARARAAGLAHVEFRPSVSPRELVALLHAADACVATTRAHAFSGETIPVKLFDYLAAGVPLVAAVCGDAAAVVEASGGGIVTPPGDGAALADAIASLADDPARAAALAAAGPPWVEREYSRRALGARLVTLVEEARRAGRGRGVAPRPRGLAAALKRAFDLAVSSVLLVLLSPVLLAVAIAVRLDSPGPALFRQRRSGRGSSEFVILKFRTMQVGTPDLASHLLGPGSSRVTRIGRFLRRSSLDELPQLFNVLSGAMSLVGPRPALHNQHDLIAMRQAAGVDALKPGVTGWAQVNGRDDIPLDRKVAFDSWYLDHVSFGTDLFILFRTAATLFSSRGVY